MLGVGHRRLKIEGMRSVTDGKPQGPTFVFPADRLVLRTILLRRAKIQDRVFALPGRLHALFLFFAVSTVSRRPEGLVDHHGRFPSTTEVSSLLTRRQ